jgi:hypothetical protein
MENKLKMAVLLSLLVGLSVRSFAEDAVKLLGIQVGDTSYKPGGAIAITLINNSTSTVHYVLDHQLKIEGKWRGWSPYDLEEPNSKLKTVKLHELKPGQHKSFKWTEPKSRNKATARIESIQFIANVTSVESPEAPTTKYYSPEVISVE